MIKDADQFLMCFLTISVSTLVKYLFISFASFLIRLFIILLLCFESSLYMLGTSPFVEHVACKSDLSALYCLHPLHRIFCATKLFNVEVQFIIFSFLNCALGFKFKNYFL